jgi:hypothetical protein
MDVEMEGVLGIGMGGLMELPMGTRMVQVKVLLTDDESGSL